MHEVSAIGDDLDALVDEAVDHPRDRLLVAGNGARGKDHAVAARKRHFRMIILGDAGERGARLALAAGAEREHLVRRQVAVDLDRTEIRDTVEIAGLARDLRDALHGAADQDDLAFAGGRGLRHRAQARHVGGEGGDGHPRRRAADKLGERFRNVGFGGRAPLAERIGGVADQRQAALVAERAQLGFISGWADNRGRIDLPIAGVKHAAERRADDEAVRFGNRMGHGYELDIEWSERESAPERHDVHRDLGRTGLAFQLGLQQRGGKRCGIDRQLEARPQVEQRAEMILVRVGEHEAENIASLLHQIADVRHDEIDTGQRVVSESNPEIDRDPLPTVFVT